MFSYPPSMRKLVNELCKLPSIGEKSAFRLAYHLLGRDKEHAFALADAIRVAREQTRFCEQCFSLTEDPLCSVCRNPKRIQTTICVVEKPADVIAIENAGGYKGLYHVLHGLWAPLRGIAPEGIRIHELIERLRHSETAEPVRELILATGTTVEGDATALYIANSVAEMELTMTRIAQGLPKGGELEYADEVTLVHALEGRQSIR